MASILEAIAAAAAGVTGGLARRKARKRAERAAADEMAYKRMQDDRAYGLKERELREVKEQRVANDKIVADEKNRLQGERESGINERFNTLESRLKSEAEARRKAERDRDEAKFDAQMKLAEFMAKMGGRDLEVDLPRGGGGGGGGVDSEGKPTKRDSGLTAAIRMELTEARNRLGKSRDMRFDENLRNLLPSINARVKEDSLQLVDAERKFQDYLQYGEQGLLDKGRQTSAVPREVVQQIEAKLQQRGFRPGTPEYEESKAKLISAYISQQTAPKTPYTPTVFDIVTGNRPNLGGVPPPRK